MACGSCGGGGGRRANTQWEVTLRDGTKQHAASMAEVRMIMNTDDTTGTNRHTYRVVPKSGDSAKSA